MYRLLPLILAFLVLLGSPFAFAQTARDTAVEVSAVVQETPPQITLQWLPTSQPATQQRVFRRLKGATRWNTIATPANTATSHVDSAVSTGVNYEYFVLRVSGTVSAQGYLSAGIRAPLVESRGKVILLVDDTMSAPLASELDTFIEDLVGDGWLVSRQDVSRTASPPAIKAAVQSLYNVDPAATRALILFGRIPVPYSGEINPDGHPEHRGAWPADVYYGDINGTWRDTSVTIDAERPENDNVPGDGKFDESTLPSAVELEVGRIDLANMSGASPGLSETDLLRQYLARDHAFRHKAGAYASVPRRGLIDDHFDYFGGEAFSSTGWRNFTSFFGSAPGAIVAQDWFTTLESESYLWAFGTGPGSYLSAGGVGSTSDFATRKSLAVFNVLFGSYFGDWNTPDNFLRAPLAARPESLGLASFWAGRPHWHLYAMALGETIGYGARVTQNNNGFLSEGYVANNSARSVHIALMGDPTLRLHPVAPPSNLTATAGPGGVALSWTASTESNLEGYALYRAASAVGPFARIRGALVNATTYTDNTGAPGQTYIYMVRAVKLESSAGGTYLNASQAAFYPGASPGGSGAEINLASQGAPIATGDTVVSTSNGTDFGSAEINVQTVTRTFTITNDGTAPLSLSGAVQLSGSAAGDFSVLAQPAAEPIAAGSSVTFQIQFTPTMVGVRAATVTIASNDADESPFTFAISGNGSPATPEIQVTPSTLAATVAPGSSAVVPLTINNSGPGVLTYTLTSSQSAYSFRESETFGGPQFSWIEISGTGTEVTGFNNPDDAMSGVIPLGFAFPFYGNSFTTLRISTNGFVTFTDQIPFSTNTGLPSPGAPSNLIAAVWDDLILDANSKIFTQQIGDLFVVEFQNLHVFEAPAQRVTCEIVLRPNGEIVLQYLDVTITQHRYTVGIQDQTRTEALQIAADTAYLRSGLAVRIQPPGLATWLSTSASSGSVPPQSSQVVNVTLNSAGLEPGFYHAALRLDSNDADEEQLDLPVQLTVSGPELELLGNGLVIADEDIVVSVVDRTDFGTSNYAASPVARTFTITNRGSEPLTIGNVAVAGSSAFAVTTAPAPTVAPSRSTSFVVTLTPATSGNLSATISFTTNDSDEGAFSFGVAGVVRTPIDTWRLENFGTAENVGDAADAADPDRDGIVNLLEYAFALNPQMSRVMGLPTPAQHADGHLQITFTRHLRRVDLTYAVEASSDLQGWTTIASSTAGAATMASTTMPAHSVTETGSGEVKIVTVEDSATAEVSTRRFLRLRVTRDQR